ncbi:MAG: CAP domain-containing protein [Thermomicrobiaceae bacterium]
MASSRLAFFTRRSATYTIRLVIVSALVLSTFNWISPARQVEANEAEFQEALGHINAYRSWIGIEPLQTHPALMDAAQSHSDYWELNSGNMPGLHNQTPGAPGYTGRTMSDRASYFGYEGSINENVGLSGSMVSTVDWSIATISHRQTLLDPRYTHVGFGAVTTQSGGMETIILGSQNWSNTAEPAWQAWPVNGTTGVGLQMLGSVPSPISNAPYPVGYPITLKYHGGGSVQFHGATLQANGSEIPIISGVGDGWLSRNTMMVLATDPLQPNTTYQVTVEATANGEPASRTWSFTTGASDSSRPTLDGAPTPATPIPPEPEITFPERLENADDAFQHIWAQADAPVHRDEVDRSWLWGPDTFMTGEEPYADSPGGTREIAYFDKSRMEINNPDADQSSQWFVTNGLLVRDMIRGAVQTGDQQFEEREPAQIAIAGDNLAINPDAPTYASLRQHSAVIPDNRQPDRTGEAVMTHITARGTINHGPEVPEGVSYGHYDDATGFNIADVFWDRISQADHYDWLYAVGHPITDPHWVYTSVGGEFQWVLVQAFQRRLLTYTPGNEVGWEIEMGNVGRHYYSWRYNEAPPH